MLRLLLATLVLALCTYPVISGPLHDAVKKGDVKQVTLLIAAGEDVNEIDRRFGSPLHLAAIWGDADMATLLIAAGADVSAEHRFGQPLYSAARVGNLEVVKILIANAAVANAPSKNGTTALHAAAENGNAEIVKILVANGANPNAKGVDGYGAMHAAGRQGHFDIVELLRSLGTTSPDIEPITNLLSDADPKAGEKYFGSLKSAGKCSTCHYVNSGDWKPGPNLYGIVDRKKAAFNGFPYSPSFGRLEGNWTVEELNAFIASPTDHVPGTRMEITGVADPLMRANLIVYLQGIGDR
jgi:cytochrome c